MNRFRSHKATYLSSSAYFAVVFRARSLFFVNCRRILMTLEKFWIRKKKVFVRYYRKQSFTSTIDLVVIGCFANKKTSIFTF